MGAGWLNLGSILLGVLTLMFPCLVLVFHLRLRPLTVSLMSFGSLGACASSIALQIFYNEHLMILKDWGAMMDTFTVLSRVVAIFLIVSLLLNGAALGVFYGAAKWCKEKRSGNQEETKSKFYP